MTRRFTGGSELKSLSTSVVAPSDGTSIGTIAAAIDTTVVRSGGAAYRCDGTASGYAQITTSPAIATSSSTFVRAWIYVTAYPTTTTQILTTRSSSQDTGSIRMTSTGTLQLWSGALTTPVQIGGDSAVVALNTWTRVEMQVKPKALGNDGINVGRLDGTVFASTTTDNNQASLTNTLRYGWSAVPGTTTSIYYDDIACNDSTGSWENSWPPAGGRVLAMLPSQLITRGTWTTDQSANNTTAANIISALSNRPPIGIADTTASTTPHQIRSAASTGTDLIEVECQSYGRAGIPGNVHRDTLSGAFLSLGDTSANTQRAQGFYLTGTLQSCQFSVKVTGAPADNLVLDVQSDSSGLPSGTALATVSVAGASLSTTAAWTPFDLGAAAQPLTAGTKYWLVLRRDGAIDASNYFQIQTTSDSYNDGGTTAYNGSAWGSVSTATNRAFRCYSSTGNATINIVHACCCDGEAIATGTKTLSLSATNPTVSAITGNFGNDGGAAGTYPSVWMWHASGFVTNPSISSMAVALHVLLTKTDTTTRVGLCCGMYGVVEYTDPQQGYVAYTRTSDSAAVYAKPAVLTTTYTDATGASQNISSGSWAVILASDMPAEGADPGAVTAVDDATFRSGYTPT